MNLSKLAAYGGAAAVGAVAAVVSFGHLRAVALAAGETTLAATLLPVSVDGLLISAAAVMVLDWRAGRRSRPAARVAFAIGCAATIAGNMASATPTPLGWAVAAWAPLALLLVTEMLVRSGGRKVAKSEAVSVATPPTKTPARDVTSSGEPVTSSDAQEEPAAPAPRKRSAPRRSNRERVIRMAAKMPTASTSELAARLKVSEATVRRYRPAPPDGLAASNGRRPAPPDSLASANGHRPAPPDSLASANGHRPANVPAVPAQQGSEGSGS